MDILHDTGVVEERQGKFTQHIYFEMENRLFRASLVYDPYPNQSFLRLEIWANTSSRWEELFYDQSVFFKWSVTEAFTPRYEVVASRFSDQLQRMIDLGKKFIRI